MAIYDEFTAAMRFKHDMLYHAKDSWPEIASVMNSTFGLEPPLPKDNLATWQFFLAVLFLQSRAPYNLLGYEQGHRLWTYITNSFTVEPQFGKEANEVLQLYVTVWTQYEQANVIPPSGVASVLLQKLGNKQLGSNVFSGTVFMDALVISATSLPWWKVFSERNQLTKSAVPVDLEEFKKFAAEAESEIL